MFGNEDRDQKIKDLQAEVSFLRERLGKVEEAVEPFRVGNLPEYFYCFQYSDPRPKVSLHRAVQLLMDNAGLQLKKVPSVPESVVLEKADSKAPL